MTAGDAQLIQDGREPVLRSIKLETLVGLRWLAIFGQTTAVLAVHFGFGYELPLVPCLVLIALSAALNVALRLWLKALRVDGARATLLLAYDILQLGALLALTGGLSNPFAFLLLAPVLVSATTLPLRQTLLLGALVVGVASVLAVVHLPLPWRPGEVFRMPALFTAGVYLSLVATLAFTGVYAFRVANEARELGQALREAELVLAREQRLSALDGLAAAAAHALGTPLGTITLVAKELAREVPPESPIAEDIALLRTQSERCRDILRKLSTLADEPEPHYQRMPLSHLIDEVSEPFTDYGVEVVVDVAGEGPEPVGRRDPAILYGLGNLLENAVDFAAARVRVDASWSADLVHVVITDDGPGFNPQVLERLGDPYVSRRAGEDRVGGGLGLGFFIAKTLLQRSGAKIAIANRRAPDHGARIAVTWPRAALEANGAPDVRLE